MNQVENIHVDSSYVNVLFQQKNVVNFEVKKYTRSMCMIIEFSKKNSVKLNWSRGRKIHFLKM